VIMQLLRDNLNLWCMGEEEEEEENDLVSWRFQFCLHELYFIVYIYLDYLLQRIK
jgi:hypothetical protein